MDFENLLKDKTKVGILVKDIDPETYGDISHKYEIETDELRYVALPDAIEICKKLSKQLEPLVMLKIANIVDKYGLECPNSINCENKGILAEHGCNGTVKDCESTCPVPVQCEFCFCEPKSKFNLENDLKKKFASNFSAYRRGN